ncbi:MAG TPA: GerMN domain-containing protein [Coriobacteriia bacterium]|jgi:hypothetical protein
MTGLVRAWRLAAAGLALAALAVLPACVAVSSDSLPSWAPRPAIPTASPVPSSHPSPERKGSLGAYFVKSGRLARVDRGGRVAATSPEGALAVLLKGPTSAEQAVGLSSAIPPRTRVLEATPDYSGNVRLDLSREFGAGGRSVAMRLRLAQVVCELTQLPNVRGVLIRIDGKRSQKFGREGFDLMRPLLRADFVDVAPVE